MTLPDITNIDVRIGEAVRAARLHTGTKQEDLAAAVGLDRTTISRYEAGSRSVPLEVLLHIAAVLQVPLSDVVPGVREIEAAWGKTTLMPEGLDMIGQALIRRPDITAQVLDYIALLTECDARSDVP